MSLVTQAWELPEYETRRREIVRKYNALLSDAKQRLEDSLRHLNDSRIDRTMSNEELSRKIRELIDYLDAAKL